MDAYDGVDVERKQEVYAPCPVNCPNGYCRGNPGQTPVSRMTRWRHLQAAAAASERARSQPVGLEDGDEESDNYAYESSAYDGNDSADASERESTNQSSSTDHDDDKSNSDSASYSASTVNSTSGSDGESGDWSR
jgi:hypothetical protein